MPAAADGADDDDIAAMLMSLGDDSSLDSDGAVPEGSTVMEMSVPTSVQEAAKLAEKEKELGKEKDKEKAKPSGNTSNAAKSILEQYMRRPRG